MHVFFIIVDLWLSLLSCKINGRLFFSTIYEVLSQVYEVLSLLKLSTTTLSLRTLIVWLLLIFFTSCCACSFNYLWHYSSSIFCCICVHFQSFLKNFDFIHSILNHIQLPDVIEKRGSIEELLIIRIRRCRL